MATIYDVAAKARVSVITVSRLLNNPKIVSPRTSARIIKAMEDLHFQPSQIARSLVKKRTNTIGVIMPNIKNTFFNSWFRYIEDYATIHDFNLLLCNTDEDPVKEMKYVKLLQSQRVDGVLIAPCSKESVEYLIKCNASFVEVDRYHEGVNNHCVATDHYYGAYIATKYLIKLGHKRIAVLKGPGRLYPDVERYLGFRDAANEQKLHIDEELIKNCEFNEQNAFNTTSQLMKMNPGPTAIFSFNSLMAIGAIKSIQNLGLSIPKHVSLLSFDEIPGYEIYRPGITHVIQPIKSLAEYSITLLIDMIKFPELVSGVKKIFLKPKLIKSDSCRQI